MRDSFERIVRSLDPAAEVVEVSPLGATGTDRVTRVDTQLPGGLRRSLVIRRYGDADRDANPRVAAHEFRLLEILRMRDVPVPAPLLVDESGAILPDPYLVLDYVAAAPEPTAREREVVRELAAALARVHSLDVAAAGLSFLRSQEMRVARLLEQRAGRGGEVEERAASLLASASPLPRRNDPTLLHGDFWPGNTLWHRRRLVAVVDWEDAALGDPLGDVANCRLELLWSFGAEAASDFVEEYRRLAPHVDFGALPYWDLFAGLRLGPHIHEWGHPEATAAAMRHECRSLLEAAVERIG